MEQILIIGAANAQHTVNFINTLLLCHETRNPITVFNTEYREYLEPEFQSFYQINQIKIINSKNLSRSNNKKVKAVWNLCQMNQRLRTECKNVQKFNICFVLYCSWQSSIWVTEFHSYLKKIVLVYFGSDVLRNKKLNNFFFRSMNDRADYIVLPNLHTKNVFSEKTQGAFDSKSVVIQYPKKMVATLLAYEPLQCKTKDREYFGLPVDKIIILCGHTATKAEQYEEMIENLDKCSPQILAKCYFVFMMTYAPEDFVAYQQQIENLLLESRLNGKVMKSRIIYEDMPKLHYACDIHITTIKTDAFSCFLQEELLSGSILIYGKWLYYHELENSSFHTFPIDDIKELPQKLEAIVRDFDSNIEKAKKNIPGIVALASEDSIRSEWDRIIFENL